MRKSIILLTVLVLILSASVAFARFSTAPSNDTTETINLVNNVDTRRIFNITVTCGSESEYESIQVDKIAPIAIYYFGEYADRDQSWSVAVVDESGAQIATATFSYSNQQFQAQSIGDGLTFEASGTSFTLTVNK